MKWYKVSGNPMKSGMRVLAYSPFYEKDPSMTYRCMNSEFVHICRDVTYVCILKPPKE